MNHNKRSLWYYIKRDRFMYLLLLPGVLWYFIFHYVPMYGVIIAFKDYKPFFGIEGIFTSKWVGLQWFRKFFQSVYCARLLKNTFLLSFYSLAVNFPSAILLALFLNELKGKLFKKTVQTISYLPHFLSAVIVCGIVREMVSTDSGLFNALIKLFGGKPIPFLSRPEWFRTIYISSGLWQGIGWSSIIYLAAMSGLDQELYDAARIDGAGVLKRMRHITIPGIRQVISIQLILAVGGILSVGAEKILLLYNPQIYSTADVISTYVYREGLGNQNYSFGTAVGLFGSLVHMVLILGTNFIAKKMGEEGIW